MDSPNGLKYARQWRRRQQQQRRERGGGQKRNGFSLNFYICVCILGGGGLLPDPATHACIFLISRIGWVYCGGGLVGGRSQGGNKWAKKVYFVRDNSLSFIIHRQVHP